MRLTTPQGRVLDVTDEVQADMGRVVYRVAGVGAFTLEREAFGYPARRDNIECTYGVLTGDRRFYGRGPLPEAPVVFGITIGGGAVFNPDRFTDPDRKDDRGCRAWWGNLPAQRAPEDGSYGGSVPDGTGKRLTDILGALTLHYLDRPDRPAIEHAQAVRFAGQRLATHQREIDRLREEIVEREAALVREMELADVQARLVQPAGVA